MVYEQDWCNRSKEVSKERAKNKYRELSKEDINREYGRNRCYMSEKEKQKLKEYQKNYCEVKRCNFW